LHPSRSQQAPEKLTAVAKLEHVLERFQAHVLHGDGAIEQHVRGTERVPVATRLAIYRDAYRARLIEALGTTYPVLAALLGEDDFDELGAAYVQTHDSPFFSIRHYGHELPSFLVTQPPYAAVPVLSELARWEWTLAEVFDAGDGKPIDADTLAQVPPEGWAHLRFRWHPSLRRLQLAWNVPQIWKAASSGEDQPTPSLEPAPVEWLLWRREVKTYFRSLSTAEGAALDAARQEASFGELCELLCLHMEEAQAPAQAAAFLRTWLAAGLILSAVS
jgi:hypothetical protein